MRLKLSDTSLLLSICRFLFENIGSLVAPKRIADYLNARGRKCDVKTVDKFLNALTDCFVLYEARRFDIHGKAELARLEKYYLVDLGLRRTVLGNKAMDVGHTLENVVYLELLRRGFEVYVGRVDQTEVDFVPNRRRLQLHPSVGNRAGPTPLARELRPLAEYQGPLSETPAHPRRRPGHGSRRHPAMQCVGMVADAKAVRLFLLTATAPGLHDFLSSIVGTMDASAVILRSIDLGSRPEVLHENPPNQGVSGHRVHGRRAPGGQEALSHTVDGRQIHRPTRVGSRRTAL